MIASDFSTYIKDFIQVYDGDRNCLYAGTCMYIGINTGLSTHNFRYNIIAKQGGYFKLKSGTIYEHKIKDK